MTYTTRAQALAADRLHLIGGTPDVHADYQARYPRVPHVHRWVVYGPDDTDPTCAGCGIPMEDDRCPAG